MSSEKDVRRNEDEYFLRQEAELLRQHRERLDSERKEQESAQRTPKCPRTGEALEEREVDGVKIDVCPSCGGVWLDAGELELLRKSGGGGGGFLSRLGLGG